jgi:hypothetical protein
VKKRCRWLHRFSTDPLSRLPGSAADPFGGAALDINSLGEIFIDKRLLCGGLGLPSSAARISPNRQPPTGWGLAAVTSRAFRVRGPAHPAALLPLVDMSNHSFNPNVEVLPGKEGGVIMVAKREVRACNCFVWCEKLIKQPLY